MYASHWVPVRADLGRRREVDLHGVVAAQPDRGQGGDADQHADHPGHDQQRAGDAVHGVGGGGEQGGVDRRERQAEPRPASTRGTVATGCDRLVSPHVDIQANPTAASTMPTAVTRPGSKRRARKPPASAPTGSATSSRTSTSAASSCEVG